MRKQQLYDLCVTLRSGPGQCRSTVSVWERGIHAAIPEEPIDNNMVPVRRRNGKGCSVVMVETVYIDFVVFNQPCDLHRVAILTSAPQGSLVLFTPGDCTI